MGTAAALVRRRPSVFVTHPLFIPLSGPLSAQACRHGDEQRCASNLGGHARPAARPWPGLLARVMQGQNFDREDALNTPRFMETIRIRTSAVAIARRPEKPLCL